jgi:hypothetical protein
MLIQTALRLPLELRCEFAHAFVNALQTTDGAALAERLCKGFESLATCTGESDFNERHWGLVG